MGGVGTSAQPMGKTGIGNLLDKTADWKRFPKRDKMDRSRGNNMLHFSVAHRNVTAWHRFCNERALRGLADSGPEEKMACPLPVLIYGEK